MRAMEVQGKRTDSVFEKLVLQRLLAARYRVQTQWPVGAYRIDLVVEGKSGRLAVECDGEKWHTAEQLQHDLDREAILRRLGWTFVRIRGSVFFRDPDAAMAPVFVKLDQLGIEPLGEGVPPPNPRRCRRASQKASRDVASAIGRRTSSGTLNPAENKKQKAKKHSGEIMQYSRLGKTGITVSRICLGCMSYGDKKWRDWVLDDNEAREHFAAALEAGINFFDTADVYSVGVSEEITGRWLSEMASRDEIVIATKVHGPMGTGPNRRGPSRKHDHRGLRRLAAPAQDRLHRPLPDPSLGLHHADRGDARCARFAGARREGPLSGRESSMAAWQFSKALNLASEHGWHRFVSMQNHYNLVYREEEREMIPLCVDQGVGLIPWSPLARGFLSGNRKRERRDRRRARSRTTSPSTCTSSEHDFAVLDAVEKVAHNRGVTPSQVAFAWILQAPGVTAPIVGATKPNHLTRPSRPWT